MKRLTPLTVSEIIDTLVERGFYNIRGKYREDIVTLTATEIRSARDFTITEGISGEMLDLRIGAFQAVRVNLHERSRER